LKKSCEAIVKETLKFDTDKLFEWNSSEEP
jgi:hypothetical protein